MLNWQWYLIGLPIAAYVLITGIMVWQMRLLGGMRIRPLTEEEAASDRRVAKISAARNWASAHEFRFLGYYAASVGNLMLAAWRAADRPTFFCQYVTPEADGAKSSFDFVTLFTDDVGLTTGSNADGHLLPPPAVSYMQSFSDLTLDDRWARHLLMEGHLIERGGAQLSQTNDSFEVALIRHTERLVEHVRSLWFWPLRGAWWYFVRRRQWHDVSISTQRERGWIRFPNEAGERP